MFLISLNRRSSCQWSRVLQTCAGLSLPWVQMLGVNPPNIFSPEHVKCCVALSLCHLRQERMASGEQNLAGESAAVRLAKQHFWCQNVPTYSMDFPWISHGFPMNFPWISHGFPWRQQALTCAHTFQRMEKCLAVVFSQIGGCLMIFVECDPSKFFNRFNIQPFLRPDLWTTDRLPWNKSRSCGRWSHGCSSRGWVTSVGPAWL